MNRPHWSIPRRRSLGALAVLAAGCGLLLTAAQADPPAPSGRSSPASDLERVRLKYAPVSEVAQQLPTLLGTEGGKGGVRLMADTRTNSLLVVGNPAAQALVRRYVAVLDIPGTEQGGTEPLFRVFPLQQVVPDEVLQKDLNVVIGKDDGRFVVDRGRRLLILSGNDERVIRAAEEFMRRLEAAQQQPAPRALRVRVLWLANTRRSQKNAVAPPRDVREAVDELARIGIEDLALVSQSVVDVTAGKEFRCQGVAQLGEMARSLSVNGTVLERPGEDVRLEVTIDVGNERDKDAGRLCRLSTAIASPLGQYVVLGVTPTEGVTSVFVLQVTPAGGKPAPRRGR